MHTAAQPTPAKEERHAREPPVQMERGYMYHTREYHTPHDEFKICTSSKMRDNELKYKIVGQTKAHCGMPYGSQTNLHSPITQDAYPNEIPGLWYDT